MSSGYASITDSLQEFIDSDEGMRLILESDGGALYNEMYKTGRKLKKNIFTDITMNYLAWGDKDRWFNMQKSSTALGLTIGYRTYLFPLRLGLGYNKDNEFFSFISVGYDYDAFEFSRR